MSHFYWQLPLLSLYSLFVNLIFPYHNIRNSKINSYYIYAELISEKLTNHSYDEWLKLGFALASIGEDGREYFLKLSLGNPNYNDSEEAINKKFDGLLKDYNGEITLGTLFRIAGEYGYKRLEVIFWREYNNKIVIDQEKFSRFLIYPALCNSPLCLY